MIHTSKHHTAVITKTILYSVRVELSTSLKKGVLCMECNVKYFITYFIHFALKYILILFITFSRECHAKD